MNCRFNLKRVLAFCSALFISCSLFLVPAAEVKATGAAASDSEKTVSTEKAEEESASSDASDKELTWPKGPSINSPSVCVMEVNTGTVLYEKNDHEKLYPASITKILTTLLTLETCDLDEVVTFSKKAVYGNEGDTSHISRDVGEEMTIEQTLYAVMLASANECAYEAAEYSGTKMGGDIDTFIEAMNTRAQELGCTDTHFNNPNGLPDPDHYTTAYDFALISCEAYKNEEFRTICGTKKYTIPPTNKHSGETYLSNHHKILHKFRDGNYVNPYCTGGKTGYTKAAKQTLVTYAEKDGITLCIVVMHANSPNQLNDTNTLINYCFNKFTKYNISESDTNLRMENEKDYGLLNENRGFATLDSDSYVILPKNASFSDVEIEETEENSDDALAVVKYSYGGHAVGSAKIVINEDAKNMSTVFDKDTADSSDTADGTETADSSETQKVYISPIAIAAIVTAILLIILAVFLITHFGLTIRQALQERKTRNVKKDWRNDKRRRARMMKAKRQRERQKQIDAQKMKETAERLERERADMANKPDPEDRP